MPGGSRIFDRDSGHKYVFKVFQYLISIIKKGAITLVRVIIKYMVVT